MLRRWKVSKYFIQLQIIVFISFNFYLNFPIQVLFKFEFLSSSILQFHYFTNNLLFKSLKSFHILNAIKKRVSYQKLNQPIALILYSILGNIFILICISLCMLKVLDNPIIDIKILPKNLRSIMSQQRLNGLAILSIEKEILKKFKYKNLIS